MVSFVIGLAGVNIEITANFPESRDFCKDYLTEGLPDFGVLVTMDDIDYERKKSVLNSEKKGETPYRYSNEYLETLAIYRKISDKILNYDTLLFHGSAVAVDGECYLFTAKSGTGKSTHTRLWREYFGDRAVMVNDDKPLLRVTEDSVLVYGTPWNGKHKLGSNIFAPLKAICFLSRGEDNRIEPVGKSYAWRFLLQQAYRPSDPKELIKVIELLDKIANAELYSLYCNMEREAAIVSYSGMNAKLQTKEVNRF